MKCSLSMILVLCFSSITFAQNPAVASESDLTAGFCQQNRKAIVLPVVLALSNQIEKDLVVEEEDLDDDLDFFEEEDEEVLKIRDPLAPWNKVMFHFNDRFYRWLLTPAAKGYRIVVPRPVRSGVKNFFHNLTTPARFVSCILQGKGNAAGAEFAGFMVNSTIGLLGIFNLTKKNPELNPAEEDIGQAFGAWGIGDGFYIVWPFLGPSTFRDSIGMVGDRLLLNPVSYIQPLEASLGVTGYQIVNDYSYHIGDYEALKEAAIEPYEAFRDAYLQHRRKMISE